jgi:hypothetical protein
LLFERRHALENVVPLADDELGVSQTHVIDERRRSIEALGIVRTAGVEQ